MAIASSRRNFIRGAFGLAALGAGDCFAIGSAAGKRIRLAAVGMMGKGYSDWLPMLKSGLVEIVAFCDCDANKLAEAKKALARDGVALDLAKIPFHTDYRRLLDDAGTLGVQAMTVSATDHTHAPVAIAAMKQGIHVFVQKPLVRTLWELDYFNKTAKEYGVVTQMGNQGSSLTGFRRGVEVLNSGILGDVTEVHVWTNRPVWPQGRNAVAAVKADPPWPMPKELNWDAWLATAQERPWRPIYHPFSWRGMFDFGCGAFGDMACHTMNLPFRGLELGAVDTVELRRIEDKTDLAFPAKSIVVLNYAARTSQTRPGVNLPAVKLTWYDGNLKPSADLMPQVIAAGLERDKETGKGKVPNTGCLIVGTRGILCSTNDYGGDSYIALKGEEKVVNIKDHEACKVVAHTIPYRSDSAATQAAQSGYAAISADGHYGEFLNAILGKGPVYAATHSRCYSDIEYAIPQMEGILVGCVAQRVGLTGAAGVFHWDAKNGRFREEAPNRYLKPYIRKGFEF